MRRRHESWALSLALLLGSVASARAAAAAAPIDLRYAAPPGCPSEAHVQAWLARDLPPAALSERTS